MYNNYENQKKDKKRKAFWGTLGVGVVGLVGAGLATSLHVVRPNQKGLVELFGKYKRTVDPGLRVIPPFGMGKMIKVPMDLRQVAIPGQSIITKEQLNANVNAVTYYRVEDPVKAIYNVDNYEHTVPTLAQTTLRNVLGTFSMEDANSQRKRINEELRSELETHVKDWGMKVINVELQKIEPTERVQRSMNEIIISDQERIAAKNRANAREIDADGERRAAIKAAEGKAQAVLLEAQARAEATRLQARAKADALQMECDTVQKHFSGNVLPYWQLKTTVESLRHNTTVLMPKDGNTWNLMDIASIAKQNHPKTIPGNPVLTGKDDSYYC